MNKRLLVPQARETRALYGYHVDLFESLLRGWGFPFQSSGPGSGLMQRAGSGKFCLVQGVAGDAKRGKRESWGGAWGLRVLGFEDLRT